MSERTALPGESDARRVFVENLSRLVKASGLSQREIASRASYPQRSLSEVLAGKTVPKHWETVERILTALNSGATRAGHDPVDLHYWQELHAIAREAPRITVSGSGVQTNIFQSGRDYTYIHGDQVAVGANNYGVIMGTAENVGSPITGEDDSQEDQVQAYLTELENEITLVAKAARRRLMAYRLLRFSALAASAITPAVALLDADPFITALIGTVAFLSEGAIQLTRINERAVLDTRRVSLLSREFRVYRTQAEDYAAEGNTFTLLVKRIEEIRQQNDNERLDVVQQSFGAHATSGDQRSIAG